MNDQSNDQPASSADGITAVRAIDEPTHLFRRQFLLGPSETRPSSAWDSQTLRQGLVLSTHADLPVAVRRAGEYVFALIGTAIDPYSPEKSPVELLGEVRPPVDVSHEFLIDTTNRWSGRWVFVCASRDQQVAISDPCGLRQIHYCRQEGIVWCGSQPEIIRTRIELRPNTRVLEFTRSNEYEQYEASLIGEQTCYEECYALLPNHRLDLRTGHVERFYPLQRVQPIATAQALEIAIRCLRGGIEGVSRTGPISLPVTAGYDSRVLLAATKSLSSDIHYFVDRKGVLPLDAADVVVPQRICQKLGLDFHVENSVVEPDREFVDMLQRNVTGARRMPKTRMIYRKHLEASNRTNINGNGSEICRFFYDSYRGKVRRTFTPEALAACMGFADNPFASRELAKWHADLQATLDKGFLSLDMLYWEQRMGRWGAQYPAEQDIAVEEFSPFNNRFLISTLLGVPARLRSAPKYGFYRQLIQQLWPEVLSEPFNPMPLPKALRQWAYKRLPDWALAAAVRVKRFVR